MTQTESQSSDPLQPSIDDHQEFAETWVELKGRDGTPTPFLFNPVQLFLEQRVRTIQDECQRRAIPTSKVLILKSRGTGCTTWAQCRQLWRAWGTPGLRGLTLAHVREKTKEIFRDMLVYQYERLPAEIRPERKSESSSELHLHKLDSILTVATAEGKSPGRGGNLHEVHGSEVAYWPTRDEKTLIAGLTEAVRQGHISMESTANGCSGWFYEQCMAALDEPSRNPWKLLFVPAYSDPQNRMVLQEGEHIEPGVPGEFDNVADVDGELAIFEHAAKHGVVIPPEYFKWRRSKKRDLDVLFPQEYPETPNEAFLASGLCRFKIRAINMGRMNMLPPIEECRMQGGDYVEWEAPREHYTYIVGVDTSEGVPGGDFSYITVHDSVSFCQVARWHGLLSPNRLGDLAMELGKRYNTALLCVERNNHGHSVLNTILHHGGGYPRVYYAPDKKAGWLTNPATRDPLIDDLAELVDSGGADGVINDPLFWSEASTFVRGKTGKYEAADGKHDDSVMAVAIALICKCTDLSRPVEVWEMPLDDAPGGWSLE